MGKSQLTSVSKQLHRVERLLNSPSLCVGTNRICACGTATVGSRAVHVYIGHLESLAWEENDLVLLDHTEQEPGENIFGASGPVETTLSQLALRFNAKHIWYISPYLRSLTTRHYAGFTLSMAEPDRLFSRIFPTPSEFSEMVTADVDVNGFGFRNAFQKRTAIFPLRSSPIGNEKEEFCYLDAELARWANSDAAESPLLLLGDRGSGKTWQLLKFCEERYKHNRESPWLQAPALYVSLRDMRGYLTSSSLPSLGLYSFLAARYAWFSVKWNTSMFKALLECNQLIICLDGLDEIEVQPSEAEVQKHFQRIVSMLPMGSRFVISSRITHFSSFDQLYSLETWPGVNVRGSFRILELAPFRLTDLAAYASVVAKSEPTAPAFEGLNDLLRDDETSDELTRALRRCSRQPALLARIVNEIKTDNRVTHFQLLQRAIEGSLIAFNIEFERTRPLHLDTRGELRTFDAQTRVAFLGELAWFMAERHLVAMDLERLPARLIRMFGVDSEALQRDIRSQTVFELVEPSASLTDRPSERETGLAAAPGAENASACVRFAFSLRDRATASSTVRPMDSKVSGVPRTPEAPSGSNDRLSVSVAESYFLASHIAARLADSRYMPGLTLAATLQYLGRVRIDSLAAQILQQMLQKNSRTVCDPRALVEHAKRCVTELARAGGSRAFMRSLRFLMENLESLGYLNTAERVQLDPWTPELISILKCPAVLGAYEFVLVPASSSEKIARIARAAGTAEAMAPFLLGVHEITNEQFAKFVVSPEGSDWAVERVTRAGSDGSNPPSRYASRTNEYHLYFWEEVDGAAGTFAPPRAFLRHPVVYVSWYAAQAFCNWLSDLDNRRPVHSFEDTGHIATPRSLEDPGFRLPAAAEWWWAAQGPNDRVTYPWETLPYDCATSDLAGSADHPRDQEASAAREWLGRYRDAALAVLLDSGRRSAEVAYDDDVGPLGAIGLIGNVKEWVDDLVPDAVSRIEKALVCGGTAHLGKPSFRVGYYAALFPENTNPDVGFRIARSLADSESDAFERRERELASLS